MEIMAMSLGINVILKTRLDGDRLNMMKRITDQTEFGSLLVSHSLTNINLSITM